MKLNLEDKIVVITGGSKGIGLEAAIAFGEEGCKLAICGRNPQVLSNARQILADKGFDIFTKALDVTDKDALSSFAKAVYDHWHRIDIWINNAGIPCHKAMMDMEDEEWNQIIAINLTAVYQGCKLAASYMKETGGVILNAGSFQTFFRAAGSGPYGATKAGVASLTRSFAGELARFNIRVLTYIPGVIETPMTKIDNWAQDTGQINNIPLRRLGTPRDIANTLVFLSSSQASYINGVSIEITGGKFCVQNPQYSWENQII